MTTKLYQPTPAETGAAIALLLRRFPDDAGRIGRGIDLLPKLRYETAAERNAFWLARGLPITVNADPGWCIAAAPDERRNAGDEEAEPRYYQIDPDLNAGRCSCWDHTCTGRHCRHVYAVLAYRLIVNAKLDAMAQAGRLTMRPAGRYEGCYDVTDAWGMTLCGVVYLARVDRWRCETDADVASFARWLTTDEIFVPVRASAERGEYV